MNVQNELKNNYSSKVNYDLIKLRNQLEKEDHIIRMKVVVCTLYLVDSYYIFEFDCIC